MVPNSMWEQGARRASGGLSGLWSISRGSYSRSACHVVGFCHFGVKRTKWQQLYRNTVMENRPVDPGSIQRSHRPLSFIRIKHRTRANDILCKTESSWSYRTFSPQKPWLYERVWCTTKLATLSLNHSNGRTHSWRFKKRTAQHAHSCYTWPQCMRHAIVQWYFIPGTTYLVYIYVSLECLRKYVFQNVLL